MFSIKHINQQGRSWAVPMQHPQCESLKSELLSSPIIKHHHDASSGKFHTCECETFFHKQHC